MRGFAKLINYFVALQFIYFNEENYNRHNGLQ